jgi:hypothetical protein
METDLTFPHHYSIERDVFLPSVHGIVPVYYYPGASRSGGRDGIWLGITPDEGTAWIGVFASGSWRGISGIYSCPDGKSLCVVSDGLGYIVRTDAPEICEEIGPPIREAKALPEVELLVFRDDTGLFAYGPDRRAWTTEPIALDGLTIDAIDGNTLRGHALVEGDITDADYVKWVDYAVDLVTGKRTGGLAR